MRDGLIVSDVRAGRRARPAAAVAQAAERWRVVNLAESARFAWQGVTANKPRSALTTLGVLIGVAVGDHPGRGRHRVEHGVQDSISSLGSNTLTVTSSSGGDRRRGGGGGSRGGGGGRRLPARRAATATTSHGHRHPDRAGRADPGRRRRRSPTSDAGPRRARRRPGRRRPPRSTATYAGASHTVGTFTGTTPAYLLDQQRHGAVGRAFTDSDVHAPRRVALVGQHRRRGPRRRRRQRPARTRPIQLNGSSFDVVGILTEKGSTGPQDQDDRVIAPLTAVQDTLSGLRRARARSRSRPPRPTPSPRPQARGRGDPRRPPRRRPPATATTRSPAPPRS